MPHGIPRLSSNLPIATAGMVAEKLISLAAMALLAQYYAQEQLGAYLVVLSLTTLSALLGDFGTNRHLLRAASIEPAAAGRLLGEVLSLRVPALTGALLLTTLGIYAWQPSLLVTTVWISIFVLGRETYYAFGAVMLALGHVRARILSGLAGPTFLFAAIFVSARQGLEFQDLMVLHACAGLIMLLAGWLFGRPSVGVLRLGPDWQRTRVLIGASWPLFVLGLLEVGLARSGEILIAVLGDLKSVAEFGLGYRIMEASRFLIRPLTMVLFPLLAATASSGNWIDYRKQARLLAGLAISIGATLGFAFGLRADLVMGYLFGEPYAAAAPIFRVFALTIPLLFLLTAQTLLLVSLNLERLATKLMALGLGLNLLVSAAVIPYYGAYGAAWSVAAAHLLLCIGFGIVVHKELRHRRVSAAQECMARA